jgi:hypothetical protein
MTAYIMYHGTILPILISRSQELGVDSSFSTFLILLKAYFYTLFVQRRGELSGQKQLRNFISMGVIPLYLYKTGDHAGIGQRMNILALAALVNGSCLLGRRLVF